MDTPVMLSILGLFLTILITSNKTSSSITKVTTIFGETQKHQGIRIEDLEETVKKMEQELLDIKAFIALEKELKSSTKNRNIR